MAKTWDASLSNLQPPSLILAVLIGLAGCAAPQPMFQAPPESANVEPTNYRAEILAHLRKSLKDPTSVRDASISKPFMSFRGAGSRYIVCVRLNAKNSFGGYSGIQDRVATFLNGTLLGIDDPHTSLDCGNAQFEKFAELERLR